MSSPSLLLVGMKPEILGLVRDAIRLAFPEAEVAEAMSVADARAQTPIAETEILVVGEPDEKTLREATSVRDGLGLPRWAVMVWGDRAGTEEGVAVTLARADWNVRTAALAFQAAARWQILSRENERLRGDLATTGRRVTHDLRTPLTAIYTACEALNEPPAEGSDQSIFTHSIATSTDELAQLIERVGFILRATAEPGRREGVPMAEVVFHTLQRWESTILRKGATVTQPARWPVVTGVAAWLEVIWFNLIGNALQHTKTAPQIELAWDEADGHVRFWVNDRGPGVARERVAKLFQPFNQLHRLDAPRGLGLALVQRLVELQDGTYGYAPRSGGGAQFYFTLPATAQT